MNVKAEGMSNELTVSIRAPITRVWDALTTPALRKLWFFGVDTETDWKVGGAIVHRSRWQGRIYEDKGVVLAFDPPRLLSHTHWSAWSGRPDLPENYELVTYALAERNGVTELTVTEANLPSAEAGSTSRKNWLVGLRKLKHLTEKSRRRTAGGWML
jgi:uncharacterized protein YndB with AHSA1/START domain